jgi:hypothetical protein
MLGTEDTDFLPARQRRFGAPGMGVGPTLSGPPPRDSLNFRQQSAQRQRATKSPFSFFSRDTRHPWADEMSV